MDPFLATFLTERLDNRPPSEATRAWLSVHPDPMASLIELHDRAGLPTPSLTPLVSTVAGPATSRLNNYFLNFHTVYAPLDQVPARVTSEQLFWTLNIIALLQDAFRLKSYLRLYGNDRSVSQRSFLWLARRGQTAAMKFLLPLIKTPQGTPQPLLRQLAEIAVQTERPALYRSTVRSLRFQRQDLQDWHWYWNEFLATLAHKPDYCRIMLLSVAERQPQQLEALLKRVFANLKQIEDWQLQLLLELVQQQKLKVENIYRYRLASTDQLQALFDLQPELGFSASEMLPQQIIADAQLEVVAPLFEHALQRQGPLALDAQLNSILAATVRSEDARIGEFMLAAYPGLSPNSCLQEIRLGEYLLGPALAAFADRSRQLFQQQLALMREITLQIQTQGRLTMVWQLQLELLSPEAAFNILSYWSFMLYADSLSYQDWRQTTGQQVLKRLQSYTTQERALILIGLGYNDSLPALDDEGSAYPLVGFCAAYHQLEAVMPLVQALEDESVPEIALHEACLFGQAPTVEWILTNYDWARYNASEWAENLQGVPGRQEVVEILKRYPWN